VTPLEERFPGRRAFVTGAGGGLGRALCLALARRGFWIGVQDKNSEAAQATAKAVNDAGARGWAFLFDVGVADDFADAAQAFIRDIGTCDVLFNNAGVAVAGTVDELPLEDWEWSSTASSPCRRRSGRTSGGPGCRSPSSAPPSSPRASPVPDAATSA
jgi:NAD(P)-dependent dehydrogenase (short-subunit alcohol dehydrogenase family)